MRGVRVSTAVLETVTQPCVMQRVGVGGLVHFDFFVAHSAGIRQIVTGPRTCQTLCPALAPRQAARRNYFWLPVRGGAVLARTMSSGIENDA